MSNSAVESSWKSSSFSRAVSHEYPALATEGLWRKQAHNNWERFVTTGVKWMKPRDCQVMQFMGKRKKKKIKEEKNTQNLLSSYTGAFIIHCDLPGMCWQTQSVLCDIVPVNWNDCTHSIVPNSRAPSSGGCTGCPATPGAVRAGLRGELCTVPLKAIQDLKKKTKTVFRAHIKTSRFLN